MESEPAYAEASPRKYLGMKVYRTVSITAMQNGYSLFTTEKERKGLTYLPGLCLAEHRLLLSARLGVSSNYLLILVAAVQISNHEFYLKGCSALKILEAVGWEKGTLERSIGEEPVEDLERGLSLGLAAPFCICLSQCLDLYRREERSRG